MKKKEKANYAHSRVCSPLLREEYMCVSKKEREREREKVVTQLKRQKGEFFFSFF